MVNYKKLLCHKLANDGGALVMMCGKDEDCFPSITTCWKTKIVYALWKVMDTCCQ
jgi:hypothetical protein